MIGSAVFAVFTTCALFGGVFTFGTRLDDYKVRSSHNFKSKMIILTQLGLLKN